MIEYLLAWAPLNIANQHRRYYDWTLGTTQALVPPYNRSDAWQRAKRGIEGELKGPSSFRSEMKAKLGYYFSRKPFAPSEVCCGIRLAVERVNYKALAAEDKLGFLEINTGTEDRLRYAGEHGIEVPETFHLLGSIYNSCMHLSGGGQGKQSLSKES